jgi:hypothetical protein
MMRPPSGGYATARWCVTLVRMERQTEGVQGTSSGGNVLARDTMCGKFGRAFGHGLGPVYVGPSNGGLRWATGAGRVISVRGWLW